MPLVPLQSFGAAGDGITDDTQAFVAALATMRAGVLYIPAGSYIIKQKLDIDKSIVSEVCAGPPWMVR